MKDNKLSGRKSKQTPTTENHKEVINPYNPVPERDKERDIENLNQFDSTSAPAKKITDVPKTDKPNDATVKARTRKK